MAKKRKLPLVLIQWEDHSSNDDWQSIDKAQEQAKPMLMSSIGWLHHENDKIYAIASTFSHDDNNVTMLMNIVKSAVVKKRVIREPTSEAKGRNIPRRSTS